MKILIVAIILAGAALAATFTPWPSALVIRYFFEKDGKAVDAALARHVPATVSTRSNERYDDADRDALLDVHYPSALEGTGKVLPVIVWIHGGGFLSGSKDHIANYLRILAGKGYAVVGVDYSLAPAHTYPTQLRQVNAALAYIARHAARLHIDASRIVLAGDSAGAHMAAQLSTIITSPEYAKAVGIVPAITPAQLAGAILYCGPYEIAKPEAGGALGWFATTVLWSYSGSRDPASNKEFALTSVIPHLTPAFPPAFISAGNGDPLLPHSLTLADALRRLGVKVDGLFFPKDQTPALPHEYQFHLDTEAGRLALARSEAFLQGVLDR